MRIPEQRRRFGVAAASVFKGTHPGKRGPSLPQRTVGIAGFGTFKEVSRAASSGVHPGKAAKIKPRQAESRSSCLAPDVRQPSIRRLSCAKSRNKDENYRKARRHNLLAESAGSRIANVFDTVDCRSL